MRNIVFNGALQRKGFKAYSEMMERKVEWDVKRSEYEDQRLVCEEKEHKGVNETAGGESLSHICGRWKVAGR